MLKKFFRVFIASMMLIVLTGCGEDDKPVLRIFNWGEYLDESILDDFEEEFDCKIVYETYDSNETMYTKLKDTNTYDILLPSEYMIERLIIEDLIQPIDMDKVTNLKNVDQSILINDFDPNQEYWVPYFSGNVGIVYDTTVVDEADLEQEWEILRNEKYAGDIYMYDSVRDSFMPALKSLGYSMNTTVPSEVEEAYQWLVEQKETMEPVYGTDEIIDAMIRGEKAMALMYSGDAAYIMYENPNMEFFMPENDGTNTWFDGMVLTSESEEPELAVEFMNYMLRDDVSLKNTEAIGYYSTNINAATTAKEEMYVDNSAYGIRYEENDEHFRYQDSETLELYNSYWEKIISQ